MARKRKPVGIAVIGRRWFARTYGNTYHSATILVFYRGGGRPLYMLTDKHYGYGEQYIETAAERLEKEGIIPPRKEHPHGGKECLWRYMEELGISYQALAVDVPREKDL